MAFAPVIPLSGLAGFRFIEQTYDRQFALYNKSPEIQRDIDHFREAAGEVETLEDLMADRSLLRVVLGAYGLDEDLDKRAYVRKVIEEGTLANDAFANRIADSAYREMAEAVGFGNFGNRLIHDSVREDLIARFQERQFEQAVGEQNVDIRVAMNFRREISEIATSENVDRSGLAAHPRLLTHAPGGGIRLQPAQAVRPRGSRPAGLRARATLPLPLWH